MKRSRLIIIATMIARNAWLGLNARPRPGRAMRLGARHEGFTLEQSLAYVDWVVGDYERYGGLGEDAIGGSRVLELGPGDNLGVALRLLGMGAERVVCLDRFVTWRDPEQQRRIHTELARRMPPDHRAQLRELLEEDGSIRAGQDRLVLVEGTGIEDADPLLAAGSFDAIISRAVLAHVFDLDPAFEAMDRALAAGGRMVHKVDLSDHRLFSDAGHNPLTFLTIPDQIYDRMRRHTGLTNRCLIDSYRERLGERRYDAELLATRLIGGEELGPPVGADRLAGELGPASALIEQIRPRLLERYRRLPDRDLAVADAFVIATKARAPAPG